MKKKKKKKKHQHHFTRMNHQFDPEKELARLIAQREIFRNVAKQLQGLKWRYHVLNGVTADTAGNSNNHHHHPNSRAFILRKLKYALRTQYEDWFPRFPPPDRCTVLLLFDSNEEAFFEIRLKPKAWPVNWPTGLDLGSAEGIEVELLSGAIYKKVLEAFREEGDGMVEEEPPRTLGLVSGSGGPRSSVVEENRLTRVIVKSEEEEIVIDDEDEEEVEEAENNVHANGQVDRRASADQGHQEAEEEDRMNGNMFHDEDLADSASSAGAAAAAASSSSSSSSAIVPPENGSPAVNPQATDTDNNSNNNNNTAEQQQQQRQQFVSGGGGGSTVFDRGQSDTVAVKLERGNSSTVTITRVARPPKRAHRMASEEAPAAASVAVPPAAANVRLIQVNPPSHHNNNNNGTTPLGQQRQQQPLAAAAAVTACGTLTMRSTANSSIFHIVGNKRPTDNLTSAQPSQPSQPQDNPKRAKVSAMSSPLVSRPSAAAADKRRAGAPTAAAASTTSTPSTARTLQPPQQQRPSSTSTPAVTAANVEEYLRAHCPSYFSVKNAHTKVQCPDCPKSLIKYLLKDHLLWVHQGLKPYHCRWQGCSFTTGWRSKAAHHVKDVHRGSYAQYIVYRGDSARRILKPPRPSESLASLKAAKKTYCSIDYQIECLNELYSHLMPQNGGNRRAGSSNDQDGSKALQQLKRELKANLRSNYGNPRDFPPLERLKVVVMFDDEKKAFFDIRLRPGLGYPTGYPFFIDDSEGTIAGLSEAIYQEVLKAVQEEEEEEERDRDEGHNNHNHNSHVSEDFLDPVNIKQEVDDNEEEELIQLDDDSDEEPLNNELQQEESYNSQVNRPQSPENNAVPESEDFFVSAISAAAAAAATSSSSSSSSASAIVPPENGSPAVNPQATDTNTNSINTAKQQQQQRRHQQSVSLGQSDAVPIKLEPSNSSTVTITRVNPLTTDPPNRAPRTGHDEAAASSVAVPPPPASGTTALPAAANFRVLQVNNRPPNSTVSPSKSKLQQQPPAAAAAAAASSERETLTMRPTANSNIFHIVGSKRPADNLTSAQPSQPAQPQDNPKRAKVSAMVECLICPKSLTKYQLKDHYLSLHLLLKPYHCQWEDCRFTTGWRNSAAAHVKDIHKSSSYAQYIMKNSRGRRSWKPPSDSESFASFKAAKQTYCNINYQIECLNELYNQLIPQNGIHQQGSSSSRAQDGSQRDPKVLQKLRELKANLRSNYGSPRNFPPLERLKVVVMFDDEKKAFFDIRLRPRLGYPTGYPFFIDDNDKGTIVGISEAIFQEVLKAVQEEEEPRGFGEGNYNNNNNNHNNNNDNHAAEDWQEPVNIKQEVDEEDEDGLIDLIDEVDEESYSDELQQEERYNSQAISPPPPASENSDLSEDFTGSANSAVASSSSSSSAAIVPPAGNGSPAVNPQAADTDNNNNNNTAEQQQQRQTTVSNGSTVNRRQSERLPIKLEPAGSSPVTSTRVGRPPKRALQMAHQEAPAAAAEFVAVLPAAAANVRVIQVNPRANNNTNTNTNIFQSQSKPQQQQRPPAGALTIEPTENSSVYRILDNNNNNKRPAGNSNAAQPSPHSQDNPKRSKVSATAAAGTSTSSSTQAARATSQAVAEHFLASAAFVEAPKAKKLDCPLCRKAFVKAAMSDHLEMEHTNRSQYVPYRCTYPGCKFTNLYRVNVLRHVQRKHGCPNAKQYIVKPAPAAAAAVVVPATRTAGSSALVSKSSAAASAKRRAVATAAAASTTSKPSTARTLQPPQQHRQRPSSTSTPAVTAANVEEYLRAHCPSYFSVKNAHTKVKCPDCPKSLIKYLLKDHLLWVHQGLKPYHCQWQGCSFTTGWRNSAAAHVKDVHKGSRYAQYIVYREEETSKPPRPFESLASLKAAKKTYCSIDYQIECLNELYNQLMPTQNGGNRRAGSSNDHQDGSQRDSKALQQLKRELKANLRSNYGSPRLFPPLERLKVVVMFDDLKKAFFDIRIRPLSGYPTGYPFLIDDSEGTICGLSEAIYQEVLKAVQEEEEEEERDRDEGHNNNNSHAAEEGLDPVNIKQEVVDEEEEEEEELITLDDDSDEDESLNNELQQEESYNSQVATDTNTTNRSSSSSNTAEQQQQRRQQQSVSLGQSETVPIKLEPAGSSTVTIIRRGRPPSNRAPRTGHNEEPTAAGAASVAVPPAHAAAAAAASCLLRWFPGHQQQQQISGEPASSPLRPN
ncbi:hypothetical protein TYRP_001526 [Tyrophagus putrescentiae]|nr:hypothetical protein TYRP_001526 [Tyrophagus putrescentiae]